MNDKTCNMNRIKVNIDLLPDISSYLTPRKIAKKKLLKYGSPTEIVWRNNSSVTLSLSDKGYLTIPYSALIIEE